MRLSPRSDPGPEPPPPRRPETRVRRPRRSPKGERRPRGAGARHRKVPGGATGRARRWAEGVPRIGGVLWGNVSTSWITFGEAREVSK